jgi:hypothetical protein
MSAFDTYDDDYMEAGARVLREREEEEAAFEKAVARPWAVRSALTKAVQRPDGMTLIGTVALEDEEEWLCIAVETGEVGLGVFDSHAHHIVARGGLVAMLAAFDVFARQWLFKSEPAKPCVCTETQEEKKP